MKTATAAEMNAQFTTYLKATEEGAVMVTENGKPVAVLVSITDEDDAERLSLAYSPRLRDILDRSRQGIAAGHGINHTEFWNQVGDGSGANKTPES